MLFACITNTAIITINIKIKQLFCNKGKMNTSRFFSYATLWGISRKISVWCVNPSPFLDNPPPPHHFTLPPCSSKNFQNPSFQSILENSNPSPPLPPPFLWREGLNYVNTNVDSRGEWLFKQLFNFLKAKFPKKMYFRDQKGLNFFIKFCKL